MQSHGRTIVCIAKKTSPDFFRGAVATWPGKGKSKKQVAHTIRGHQSPRFKDNPGASEAKPCYYQGDSQHCQEGMEPTAQALAPAPPCECCPRSSTRPEWQCDGPWSEVARWDGNSKQDPSMPQGRPMAPGVRGFCGGESQSQIHRFPAHSLDRGKDGMKKG